MKILNEKQVGPFLAKLEKRASGSIKEDDIQKLVKKIIADVQKNGDKAVIKYTKKFDSVELNSLIDHAVKENFSIKETWARLRQARYSAIKAGAALYPELKVNGSSTYFDSKTGKVKNNQLGRDDIAGGVCDHKPFWWKGKRRTDQAYCKWSYCYPGNGYRIFHHLVGRYAHHSRWCISHG